MLLDEVPAFDLSGEFVGRRKERSTRNKRQEAYKVTPPGEARGTGKALTQLHGYVRKRKCPRIPPLPRGGGTGTARCTSSHCTRLDTEPRAATIDHSRLAREVRFTLQCTRVLISCAATIRCAARPRRVAGTDLACRLYTYPSTKQHRWLGDSQTLESWSCDLCPRQSATGNEAVWPRGSTMSLDWV